MIISDEWEITKNKGTERPLTAKYYFTDKKV
jgi:peptide methionine sulfoxide reductase MsrB